MNQLKEDSLQPALAQNNQPLQHNLQVHNAQYQSNYEKLLNINSPLPHSQFSRTNLSPYLLSHNIVYDQSSFVEQIHISVLQHTSNYEALKINVSHGQFTIVVNVINVDTKDPMNHLEQSYLGGFGEVYKYFVDQTKIAIKSIKKKEKYQTCLRQVLKEYFFFTIASAMKLGPKLIKIFGFDIVAFSNSFIFSMQFCDKEDSYKQYSLLLSKLSLMHNFNMVHLDIKPENISFSPYFNEFIFIDYGLSRIIKQQVGRKSFTSFVGSFNFCSPEMLQLYFKQESGFVDLYYNDAFCLNKSIKTLQLQQQEHERVEIHLQTRVQLVNNFQSNQFNLCHISLKIKFFLFQFSFGETDLTLEYLQKNRLFIDKNRQIFDKFVSYLPQSYYFTQFLKQKLNNNKSVQNWFLKKQPNSQQIPNLFIDRFEAIKCISQFQSEVKEIQIDLFNFDKVAKFNPLCYRQALIKFIKINNGVESFPQKINACKIFSQLFFKNESNTTDLQLYNKTIVYIFEISLSGNSMSYGCLLNCIETIVILQMVCQDKLISSFQSILQLEYQFIPKIRLVMQFISSLQFIKEKYKSNYCYNRLLSAFMNKLKSFIDTEAYQKDNSSYQAIVQKLKFIIADKLQLNYTANQQQIFFDEKQIQRQPKSLKQLNHRLMIYSFSHQISYWMAKFGIYQQTNLKILKALLNKVDGFSYAHFLLFTITYKNDEHGLNSRIYQLFLSHFSHLEQHKNFNIYFMNKLKRVKERYGKNFLIQRKQINKECIGEDKLLLEQIFSLLDTIVKKTDEFHQYLVQLFQIVTIQSSELCMKQIIKLVNNNIYKITKLSFKYHQYDKELHDNKLSNQIHAISCIFQIMSQHRPSQSLSTQIKLFTQQCQQLIIKQKCFQCKVNCLLDIQQIQHRISNQQQAQQAFMMIVDTLVFFVKHKEFRIYAIRLLTTNLIRRWTTSPYLFEKYDLNLVLYEMIVTTKQYHYCLTDLKQYNIFFHLYFYIAFTRDSLQVIQFVVNLLQSLKSKRSVLYIQHFYYSLLEIIKINRQKKSIDFILYHKQIIEDLLKLRNHRCRNWFALYYSPFLQIRIKSDLQQRMLKEISLSLQYFNNYVKILILNRYYKNFSFYFQNSRKKHKYLRYKHLKHSLESFQLKLIIKRKLKIKQDRFEIHRKKMNLMKALIKKYHTNINNVI